MGVESVCLAIGRGMGLWGRRGLAAVSKTVECKCCVSQKGPTGGEGIPSRQ